MVGVGARPVLHPPLGWYPWSSSRARKPLCPAPPSDSATAFSPPGQDGGGGAALLSSSRHPTPLFPEAIWCLPSAITTQSPKSRCARSPRPATDAVPTTALYLCPVRSGPQRQPWGQPQRRVLLLFCIYKDIISFFKEYFMYLSLERREGRERNINVWLPLVHPPQGTLPETQAHALTGN